MAHILTVRRIDPKLHAALRERASSGGRSVEAEVRSILAKTCLPQASADWTNGLRERARARTGNHPQSDSADLIRQGRDER